MAKSISTKRRTIQILAAACGGMGGLALEPARGGLMVDLRALPGPGYVVSGDGKSVAPADYGTTISIAVFAKITGTNNIQLVGNFDGQGNAPDTRNDDSLDALVGSFFSGAGGLLGNMNSAPGPVNYETAVTPFDVPFTQDGFANDFDSDGDLDIGSLGNDPTEKWAIRSGAFTYATRLNGTTDGWTNADLGSQSPSGFGANAEDMLIDQSSSILRIGTFQFTPSGGAGNAPLNYIPRPPGSGLGGLWFEDGSTTGKNPDNSPLTIGAPVVVSLIPEPTGLLGLVTMGLVARRKR
jgi:hypothetical protein